MVTPAQVIDLAERLIQAWKAIRSQTGGLEPIDAEQIVAELLRRRRVLPSQWLPECTERAVTDR
nr:hypothetical protein GCM10020063_009570 [Dactylosporangium thailandense]